MLSFLYSLTFSGQLKGDDSVTLFEWGWLFVGSLNVNVDSVRDGFTKRKIHELCGIKAMFSIVDINGT